MWVREAWVGIVLPLSPRHRHGAWRTIGVLTGPRSRLGTLWAFLAGRMERITGYAVEVDEAISELERHRPKTAQWWRDNGAHLLGGETMLIFDEDSCQPS